MDNDTVYIPSPSDDYIGLTKTSTGRLLRKQILPMNKSFVHPADKTSKIFVDEGMAKKLVENFNKQYCPKVQVPVVNDKNAHVEDPLRNAGEVIDVSYDDTGVYATIDARKWSDDFGKTILGASAFLHLNYEDSATGEKVGPTLLHVAATNRPYVTGLKDFEDLVKASADIKNEQAIFLTPDEEEAESPAEQVTQTPETSGTEQVEDTETMTKEEMIAALEAEGYKALPVAEVETLKTDAAKAAELSGQLDAVNEQLRLSASDEVISVADLASGLVELSATVEEKSKQIEELQLSNQQYAHKAAEDEVDSLVKAGRVLPKQRDAMVELALSNRETFDALVPEQSIVSLSETGVTVHENPDDEAEKAERMSRYASMAQAIGARTKNA